MVSGSTCGILTFVREHPASVPATVHHVLRECRAMGVAVAASALHTMLVLKPGVQQPQARTGEIWHPTAAGPGIQAWPGTSPAAAAAAPRSPVSVPRRTLLPAPAVGYTKNNKAINSIALRICTEADELRCTIANTFSAANSGPSLLWRSLGYASYRFPPPTHNSTMRVAVVCPPRQQCALRRCVAICACRHTTASISTREHRVRMCGELARECWQLASNPPNPP